MCFNNWQFFKRIFTLNPINQPRAQDVEILSANFAGCKTFIVDITTSREYTLSAMNIYYFYVTGLRGLTVMMLAWIARDQGSIPIEALYF